MDPKTKELSTKDADVKKPDPSTQPTQTGVNTQSTKPVVGASAPVPDPDAKKIEDAKPGDEGKPEELTPEEQAKLETILDGGEDDDAPAVTGNRTMIGESVNKLLRLLEATKDAPEEHPTWGAAGIALTLGDLRNIARALD